MAPRLRRRGVLIGLAAMAAVAVGVAAAQRPAAGTDQPAQLDRTFGADDGGVGGAGAPGVLDGGEGVGGSGALDGGASPVAGAVDAGAAVGGSGPPDTSARGRDGGTGDSGTGGSAQAGSHTNIIVYGPNGIPPETGSAGR